MKHLMKIIILLVTFTTSNVVMAAKVSESTAKHVAFNVVKNVDSRVASSSLSLVYTSVQANQTLMYVFGYTHGFVIISADDRVIPVIGYSTESAFIVPKNTTDTIIGNNFWGMMKNYEHQISYVLDNNISATDDIRAQWSTLITGQSPRNMTTVVTPLLTTTWNQDWPYNSMCPVDASGPGGHVYAGCVATAMAQILKYHNYPSQGLGSYGYQYGGYPQTTANFGATTYNWGNMPNSISVVNTDIATLIYQTAVSCRSMWGAGSTGVGYLNNEDPMTRAFVNYFKCAFSTLKYVNKAAYSSTDWDNLIQGELLASYPVYYRGDGSLSHAFVCDGVDASNLYHFNWGWGGNFNGYFALSNLNPGGNNLTNNQAAIIGIKPNDGSTLVVNTTWSGNVTKSTHVAVPDAITLTVNAGALVKFAQNCKLQVWGRILSTGTSSSYATFTAIDTTTGWWGIKFDNNYMNFEVMSDNDTSKFIYSQVQYSDMRGITIKNFSKVVIDQSKINNNFIDGDEYGYYNGHGAGVFVDNAVVKITNSDIYNNHAMVNGGGVRIIFNDVPISYVSNNHLYGNYGDAIGGAFYFQCAVVFSDNVVDNNHSYQGAGGALGSGNISIIKNKFCNNSTTLSNGKGLALYLTSCNLSTNVTNNLFANNGSSNGYGAGTLYINSCSPHILNNTITNNYSSIGSGIVFVNNADAYVKNCIIYGNQATNYGNQIAINTADSDPYFDNCDIEGGLTGFGGNGSGANYTTGNYNINNIVTDPQIVSPTAGTGNGYNGLTADWSLQSISPCINTADSIGVSNLLPPLDLGGNPRFNGILDMGAYEYACTAVPVSVIIAASSNPVCAGTTVTFTATPTNGGTPPAYQWKKNGTNVGINSNTYAYIPVDGDVITCVLTSNLTCVTGNPATSNAITMTVTTSLAVSVIIIADQNPVCAGTTVTFTATPTNGGTPPAYQWKKNGTNTGSNSPTYAYIPVDGDIIICILTSSLTCTTGNPATSNAITMTVTTSLVVSVIIAADQNPVCAGTTVTFTATPTNGGTPPAYQWKKNGTNVGSNSPTYAYIPVDGDVITCILTSSLTCTTGNPATSNAITMTVTTSLAVSVIIIADQNPTCAGTTVTFTATPTNGGTTPVYQWKKNGTNVGSNSNTYAYIPVDGDVITCVLTSNLTCVTGNPATSNAITMTVNALPLVPDQPSGPDTVDVKTVISSVYTTVPASGADSCIWELAPVSAGVISWTGITTATVLWNPNYLGSSTVKVKSLNACGESQWSQEKITFVDNTTGIVQYEPVRVVLYPNPCNGEFFITSSERLSKVILFDQLGKPLSEVTTPDENLSYDYRQMPVGVYFVHITSIHMNVIKKLIITH